MTVLTLNSRHKSSVKKVITAVVNTKHLTVTSQCLPSKFSTFGRLSLALRCAGLTNLRSSLFPQLVGILHALRTPRKGAGLRFGSLLVAVRQLVGLRRYVAVGFFARYARAVLGCSVFTNTMRANQFDSQGRRLGQFLNRGGYKRNANHHWHNQFLFTPAVLPSKRSLPCSISTWGGSKLLLSHPVKIFQGGQAAASYDAYFSLRIFQQAWVRSGLMLPLQKGLLLMAADFVTASSVGYSLASTHFLQQARNVDDLLPVDNLQSSLQQVETTAALGENTASPVEFSLSISGSTIGDSTHTAAQQVAHFFSKLLDTASCDATDELFAVDHLSTHTQSDTSAGEGVCAVSVCYNFSHEFFVLASDFWLLQTAGTCVSTVVRRPRWGLASQPADSRELAASDGFFGNTSLDIGNSTLTNPSTSEVGAGVTSLWASLFFYFFSVYGYNHTSN